MSELTITQDFRWNSKVEQYTQVHACTQQIQKYPFSDGPFYNDDMQCDVTFSTCAQIDHITFTSEDI